MKTFNELVVEAVEITKAQNLPRYEKNPGTKIKPQVSSGPENRFFTETLLRLCEENGITPPAGTKTREEYLTHFSEDAISLRLGEMRRTNAKKKSLISFTSSVSGYSGDDKKIEIFTDATQSFGEVDKEFIYKSYVLRSIAEEHQNVKKEGYVDLTNEELKAIAKECFKETIHEWEGKLQQPIPAPHSKDDKARDISVVIGVPGSGKSTFINTRIKDGYIPIDLDAIAVKIATKKQISINDYGRDIYRQAGEVAKIEAAFAMKNGYNLSIEKIGHTKKEIEDFTKTYKEVAKIGGYEPTARLSCAHVSKEASVVRASGRTIDQIKNQETLRYYSDDDVFCKDNVSIFSYIEILKDQMESEEEPLFYEMDIKIREGLSEVDEELTSLKFNEEIRERYRQTHMVATQSKKPRAKVSEMSMEEIMEQAMTH